MRNASTRMFATVGLLLALALGLFVSPFASPDPDGLNRVAEDKGFADSETDHGLRDSLLADYAVRGVENEPLSKGLSGAIGILVTFALGLGLFARLRRRREAGPAEGEPL
ncbi:MAG: PDGLE domain-containing protein [Actinomycetota bacterium]